MMLAQFQSLYSQGSLISELLQIHNGKHIVRVSVQIQGITRVTGMAASETIEEAEDRARERALSLLSDEQVNQEVGNLSSQEISSKEIPSKEIFSEVKQNSSSPTTSQTTSQTNSLTTSCLDESNKNDTFPQESKGAKVEETDNTSQKLQQEHKSEKKEDAIAVSSDQQITEEELSPIPLESLYSQAASTEKELDTKTTTPDIPNISTIPTTPTTPKYAHIDESIDESELSISPSTNLTNDFQNSTEDVTNLSSQNQEEQLSLISSENLSSPENQTSETKILETTGTSKTTKKKTTTSRRKKKTEPVDDSDTIAKIGVEMKRLGWTIEDGREHLRKTYNKISRHLLTPEELQDFLSYLESQELSSLEPLPLDPNF